MQGNKLSTISLKHFKDSLEFSFVHPLTTLLCVLAASFKMPWRRVSSTQNVYAINLVWGEHWNKHKSTHWITFCILCRVHVVISSICFNSGILNDDVTLYLSNGRIWQHTIWIMVRCLRQIGPLRMDLWEPIFDQTIIKSSVKTDSRKLLFASHVYKLSRPSVVKPHGRIAYHCDILGAIETTKMAFFITKCVILPLHC